MSDEQPVDIEGPDLPWTGSAVRAWAAVVSNRIDAGVDEVRVDLEHHGRGSDDVTFRIRKVNKPE